MHSRNKTNSSISRNMSFLRNIEISDEEYPAEDLTSKQLASVIVVHDRLA